ncbi:MAG TPA: Hpt domain-containing protein [Longimicrobiales bacterium]|nr:Hpt domain-containing protein [Longimicrobiales bacterium]
MKDELPVVEDAAIERLVRLGGPDLVRQMADLYFQHGPERLDLLRQGVEADDASSVERAAHALKSSAGNLGARRLQRTADMVEALAAEGVIETELIARLRTDHAASVSALRSILQELAP